MFNNIGPFELLIIGVVAMVLFGPQKITEFAKSLGQATKEFSKELKEEPEAPKKSKPAVTKEKPTQEGR